MAVSMTRSAFVLVTMAAVYIQIYQAYDIQQRCLCPTTQKFNRFHNITDFEVHEKRSGCEKTELIFTVAKDDNSTERICINTVGKIAKAFIRCWENKLRNETRKIECIEKARRAS